MIDKVIKEYKDKYGESEYQMQGFREYLKHEGFTGDVMTIEEIEEFHKNEDGIKELINKLANSKVDEFVDIDFYYYQKNMVRIKEGWYAQLLSDIRNYT